MNKKNIANFSFCFLSFFLFFLVIGRKVFAIQQIESPVPGFSFTKLFDWVIALIPIVLVIGAFGGVIVMAATLIFSWGQSGDAEPVKKVRTIAMYMIAGIMIVILAPFLLALLLNLMGVTGFDTFLPF